MCSYLHKSTGRSDTIFSTISVRQIKLFATHHRIGFIESVVQNYGVIAVKSDFKENLVMLYKTIKVVQLIVVQVLVCTWRKVSNLQNRNKCNSKLWCWND